MADDQRGTKESARSLSPNMEKQKPISGRVREAIASMVTGESKNITAAAIKVGLTREHLSRELSKPHIAAFMHQKVQRNLAIAATRAGAAKVELLDCDNAMVRDRASSFVLGLAGIQPASQPSVNVNIEVRAGYVIDLSDDPAPAPKVIDYV
ncbi:hypothetical protein JQ621_03105 [Bradyrhizobium manausense]|uniref:hypothetical protein n=1 Tax=Bradyrhizobium manausense TaxID=989370 RepID=UPI001BACF886|nr:hypothetical protein [Bradyrhizobium manausense]MBR1086456.1 hypothetical protein [Bradyrhizobium manausense]